MSNTLSATWGPVSAPAPTATPAEKVPEPKVLTSPPTATKPDGIATAEELRQRLAARAKPAPQPSLTPKGMDAVHALRQAENTNEHRIAHLRNRLGNAHERLHTDHAKAQIAGKAKVGFGRGR